MQATPPKNNPTGTAPDSNPAFADLVNLPTGTDKDTLILTIDSAVTLVVSELTNHTKGELPAPLLVRVQTALAFLEQCLAFKDQEFTAFAKKRALELQSALGNTIKRLEGTQSGPKAGPTPAPLPPPGPPPAAPAPQVAPSQSTDFPYLREEAILRDYAFKRLSARLAFLRGDHVKVINQKAVTLSGINCDGVPVFFLLSPDFPPILYGAVDALLHEKRDLLSRRIYIHTTPDESDDDILTLYRETYHRDIDGIIALAFDDWSGEIAKADIKGTSLPQEKRLITGGKKEEKSGIGSSLKKVFSFKDKNTQKTPPLTTTKTPNSLALRIHKEWLALEAKGVFNLSQHFSFSVLSYVIQLSEKQFQTEYDCIVQIVDQQEEPDVGPVIANLSRLYKFYDNIFFDLVILTLFQRKNAFDINMLQAACMSQNFVVERLPLTMDELRRRPMEHAKLILRTLADQADKDTVKRAISDYFHVHHTIHASKVGKRLQASENLLKRRAEKAIGSELKILKEILGILSEVASLKARQESDGVFLGEEILDTITIGVQRAMSHLP
ncbi:hypothetical protein [Terasakiella pusilla]|uniref:hypothetical protein n=1 Tax=Terasakiella pusilla TaxID=64973 RepID=UPI003AA8A8A8